MATLAIKIGNKARLRSSLCSNAAKMPGKLQNDRKILNVNSATFEILQDLVIRCFIAWTLEVQLADNSGEPQEGLGCCQGAVGLAAANVEHSMGRQGHIWKWEATSTQMNRLGDSSDNLTCPDDSKHTVIFQVLFQSARSNVQLCRPVLQLHPHLSSVGDIYSWINLPVLYAACPLCSLPACYRAASRDGSLAATSPTVEMNQCLPSPAYTVSSTRVLWQYPRYQPSSWPELTHKTDTIYQ